MKILKLTAENVKKLRAVEITPTGELVEVTGRNGAGKTSVLDAIWWALAGTKHIQAVPIRTRALADRAPRGPWGPAGPPARSPRAPSARGGRVPTPAPPFPFVSQEPR